MKRFLTTILAVLLATCAWSADVPPVQVMQGGKILPQYLGINATDSLDWNSTTGELKYSAESGRLRAVTYYTSNATYTKPAWLKFVRVRLQGSGGGGAGTPETGSGQYVCGGHGGGGGYAEKFILATALDANTTVTIGAGGLGGVAGQNDGGTGATTSFGSHVSASGGSGGTAIAAVANTSASIATSGNGGVGIGGDINCQGWRVPRAVCIAGAILHSGGANSLFGLGGFSSTSGAGSASGYGSGGSGAVAGSSIAARAGTPGMPGLIIIEEYE